MKRKCKEYSLDRFKHQFPELANSNVRIFYDCEDEKQLKKMVYEIISPFNNKFRRILSVVLKNEYHDNLYKKEDTNVTAMKFSGKKNARIYCKEIFKDGKKVVMISPHFKKVKKNQDDPKIINIINNIKSYEYEI